MSREFRKPKSGAQKRKQAVTRENEKKKLPKITSFFSSHAGDIAEDGDGIQKTQPSCVEDSSTKNLPVKCDVQNDNFGNIAHAQEHSAQNEPDLTERNDISQISDMQQESVISDLEKTHKNTEDKTKQPVMAEIDVVCQQDTDHQSMHLLLKNDKGLYDPDAVLTSNEKRYLVDAGPCRPNGPFPRDTNGRSFSSFYYKKTSKSGLQTERFWLCYSMILDKCYCLPCWLFSNASVSFAKGFDDWHHLQQSISRHEKNQEHSLSCSIYDKWRLNKTLDHELEALMREEISYWRKILQRIIDVTLTLASCNLPFRGHNESADSPNPGVFLEVINLLSRYDPVLRMLLEEKKKNSTTYMSPMIQNEIITMIAENVKAKIVSDIRKAPFFAFIVDSTQDVSKIDQLSVIVRYVELKYLENKPSKIEINESFLGFIPVVDQTGQNLAQVLVNDVIHANKLEVKKLSGQGYDGGANMSGRYKGCQAELREVSEKAVYVHCAAHSLNLVLNDSVKSVDKIRDFYDFLEQVYIFFGHSIKRWDLLESESNSDTNLTLKRLNPTRWSSRHDALRAIRFKYTYVLKTLTKILLTTDKKGEKDEALNLKQTLEKFETVFLIALESKILNIIDCVSKELQNKQQNIEKAAVMLNEAYVSMSHLSENFDGLKKTAVELAEKWGTTTEFAIKRKGRPKKQFNEKSGHFIIENEEDHFRINVFHKTVDIAITQLQERNAGLKEVVHVFRVVSPAFLSESTDDEIFRAGQDFFTKYSEDVSDQLPFQLLSFKTCFKNDLINIQTTQEMFDHIVIKNYSSCSSYTEIITTCYLFLTIPVTVASAERSFSKLKLIKNYLRNTTGQERLSSLAIISIENKVARDINIAKLIDVFANMKVRRKDLSKV